MKNRAFDHSKYKDWIDPSQVIPYERNAKQHTNKQVKNIVNSIKRFGWQQDTAITTDNVCVIGHGRRLAALKIGCEMPYHRIDKNADELTDADIRELRVADNQTNSETGYDFDIMNAEIEDLEFEGFDFDFIDADSEPNAKVIEDDYDEELPIIPKAQLGQIYQLGEHRLMCGDSTDAAMFDALMDGKQGTLTVTSPPYGVGKSYEKKGIEPWFATMRPVIANVTKYSKIICWNLGDLYSTGNQFIEPTSFYSCQMFGEKGFKPIWIRIWEKQGMNFGVGPYHLVTNKPVQQYEYISAFENQGETEDEPCDMTDYVWLTAYAEHNYKFVKRLSKQERRKWGYAGIWQMNTVTANKKHPAMFPVELPWRCIKMHSDENDIVVEPFNGSGTTIIACEQLNRKCYAMERDPKYIDLAIDRWEQFTGKKAVLLNG